MDQDLALENYLQMRELYLIMVWRSRCQMIWIVTTCKKESTGINDTKNAYSNYCMCILSTYMYFHKLHRYGILFALRMAIGWSPGPEEAQQFRNDFEVLECRKHFLTAKPARKDEMPKRCEEILYSISFFTFEGKELFV